MPKLNRAAFLDSLLGKKNLMTFTFFCRFKGELKNKFITELSTSDLSANKLSEKAYKFYSENKDKKFIE